MAEFPISFGTQSHGGRFPPMTGPRHINAYAEPVLEGEPGLQYVAGDGLASFATVTSGGACRGLLSATPTRLIAVSGHLVVEADQGGGVSNIGAIPGADPVIMARNAKSPYQVAFVSEGKRFYLEGETFAAITDEDLPPPNSVTFADQRVIYTTPDGEIWWSDIDDVTSIGGLSFSTAEGAPDGLVRGFFHRLDVWLFGGSTIEIWRSTADTDEPFRRVSGGFLEQGSESPRSVASLNETIFWVNDKAQVVMATGYQPQVISHLAISRDIKAVTNKATIIGSAYFSKGTPWYVISSTETGATWTWAFNQLTGKWHEKDSFSSGLLGHWRGQFIEKFGNKVVAGDYSSNALYTVSQDTFDENGNVLVWTLRSPPVHAYPHRVSVDTLYLDVLTGVGLNSTDTDDSDPQIMLRWSDDGGHTFSNEMRRSLGAQGQRLTRVAFNNLGTTGRQGRIFELKCSAAVARGLRHAFIEGSVAGT